MDREKFFKKIDAINDELITIRRHIHAHPELSGLENQTAILISGFLKNIGWRVTESVGRTGLIAEFGPEDKGFIGLRVDMDALPILEKTNLSYSSKVDGIMHACGHDLHISIGLGVAKIIKDLKLNFGTRIIFQPAELQVEIKGKSGHGARPHEGLDAIWVASKVISTIQELVTRKLDPLDPVVITFGKISGGNAYNILAEKVNLVGTVRCTNLKLFKIMGNWLNKNISSLASSYGAQAKINFREITPPVNNDFEINKVIRDSAIQILGQENVFELQKPSLGAEDFAEFLNEVPGAMFRLGVSNEQGCSPLHSSTFNPDECAIAVGIKVIIESIVKLNEKLAKKVSNEN